MIFAKLIKFAFKATWGIFKILIFLVFLPVTLIGLVFAGLMYVALPVLMVVGVVSLFAKV